ncbi:MAG: geranylgeranylglycerol-phosphate geranylgeranyltransferase [Bacteroidales bacterium]|nr:geranylgeranylglycerol-phosphate geranylgeranyltransferase [Bacteroidales bacterium]
MKLIFNWLKLVRLPNLLMMALIVLTVRFAIVLPFLRVAGIVEVPTVLALALFLMAVLSTAAAGNVINDIADIEIDRINKPDKLIVGNKIAVKTARNVYFALVSVAMLAAIGLSFLSKNLNLFILIGMVNGLLWFYAQRYKQQLVIGNLVVAFLAALLVLIAGFFDIFFLMEQAISWAKATTVIEMILEIVGVYAVFAFLVSLIRELVKDMQDIKGDAKVGCRSIPVVLGISVSSYIVWALQAVLLAVIGWWQITLFRDGAIAAFGFLFITDMLILLSGFQLIGNPKRREFGIVSSLLKLVMLTGILSILFISL